VVKVFAIHDPTLPLAAHKEKVEEIRNKLASAVNCLPFQRAMVRIYRHSSLLPSRLCNLLVRLSTFVFVFIFHPRNHYKMISDTS
jgi:phosphoinositide-3-kinase regulatory subunit 4